MISDMVAWGPYLPIVRSGRDAKGDGTLRGMCEGFVVGWEWGYCIVVNK